MLLARPNVCGWLKKKHGKAIIRNGCTSLISECKWNICGFASDGNTAQHSNCRYLLMRWTFTIHWIYFIIILFTLIVKFRQSKKSSSASNQFYHLHARAGWLPERRKTKRKRFSAYKFTFLPWFACKMAINKRKDQLISKNDTFSLCSIDCGYVIYRWRYDCFHFMSFTILYTFICEYKGSQPHTTHAHTGARAQPYPSKSLVDFVKWKERAAILSKIYRRNESKPHHN